MPSGAWRTGGGVRRRTPIAGTRDCARSLNTQYHEHRWSRAAGMCKGSLEPHAGQPSRSPSAMHQYHALKLRQMGSSPAGLSLSGRGSAGVGGGIPEEVADDAGQSTHQGRGGE